MVLARGHRAHPASSAALTAASAATTPFPDCCLPGGFGLISGTRFGADRADFRIRPLVTSAAVRSGDTMVMRVPQGPGVQGIPGAIGFVFNTVPALKSWSAGARSARLSYPAPQGLMGPARTTFSCLTPPISA